VDDCAWTISFDNGCADLFFIICFYGFSKDISSAIYMKYIKGFVPIRKKVLSPFGIEDIAYAYAPNPKLFASESIPTLPITGNNYSEPLSRSYIAEYFNPSSPTP
jgi:hypothetical protein